MLDKPSYAIVAGPPPEPFENYAVRARSEYQRLLGWDAPEDHFQSFFERNPCSVPGVRSVGAHPSAFPAHSLLISQPRLVGLRERRPDFMWVAVNSVACHPTLVEIERPSKTVFTSSGVPSAQFSHARHQLTQWRSWFSVPANVQTFISAYNLDRYHWVDRVDPKYILLYGRRSEFSSHPERIRDRSHLLDERDEFLVSYDRVSFDSVLGNAITVVTKPNQRFQALAVQSTFCLGPSDAGRLVHIDGLDDAITANEEIPPARKDFLCSRLAYWTDWAHERSQSRDVRWHIIDPSDRE